MMSLRFLVAAVLAVARMAGGEPTNAAEAAAKKAAADGHLDELYRQKVAVLSPERQAWERTLQENLGNAFYLPNHKRDFVRGASTAWDYVEDDPALPRVLIIGDSISRGYTLSVRRLLAGKANVHRAPENCGPTANGVKKLEVWLAGQRWDVVTWNFGIHDRRTDPKIYRANLETLLRRLQATGAQLVWVRTTPASPSGVNQEGYTEAQCDQLNRIADAVMQANNVPEVDLFSSMRPRLAELQLPDNVHFREAGYELMGAEVAKAILAH